MPPLIQKWNELKDEDKDLFPLLEVSGLQALSQHPSPPCLKLTSPPFFFLPSSACLPWPLPCRVASCPTVSPSTSAV